MTLHVLSMDFDVARETEITRFDEQEDNCGMGLSVLRLKAGESQDYTTESETAWLLMDGKVTIAVEGEKEVTFERHSLFDENPSCIHVPAGTAVKITAELDTEFTVHSAANTLNFPVEIYYPEDVTSEIFGKGEVGGTCERLVRTIFDKSHENSDLVLGEIINPPGKWSSYPPHTHPESELYHYRFDRSQGFGVGQAGEDEFIMIHDGDSFKIIDGIPHCQAAAPGYTLYYSWTMLNNLPGKDWTRIFDTKHEWTRDPEAKVWSLPKSP